MGKLCANVYKELLLLFRDYTGLLIVFLMPVVLVMVFTLVQQNVLESSGETKIKTLFLDEDGQTAGAKLEELLNKADTLKLVKEVNGT